MIFQKPKFKVLDMRMMIEFLISTKEKLLMEIWVLGVRAVDQRTDKEVDNRRLFLKFSFSKMEISEVLGYTELF